MVVGSLNADLTLRVHRIPVPGETVVADETLRAPGGKGGNQAHAAARTMPGVVARMVGAVGRDDAGRELLADLERSGVDTAGVRAVDAPSGTAVIALDPDGRNTIVVAPGANHRWDTPPAVGADAGDIVVLQLELPLDVVAAAAREAADAGARILLNAAPVTPGAAELLPFVDVLVVNELEATELLGLDPDDETSLRRAAAGADVDLIVTLGENGVAVAERSGRTARLPALPATVVDTVGAGDAFVGALAACLAAGEDLSTAARRGTAAAALTVAVPGARRPDLAPDQVDRALAGPHGPHGEAAT